MKIVKAAIRINGKVYTGKDHSEAINKAKTAGVDISNIDRERDGLFLTDTGKLIDRKQAKEKFGADHSHEIVSRATKKGRKFVIVTKDFSGLGFGLDQRNKDNGDTIIFATNPDIEKLKENDELDKFNNIGNGLIQRFELKDVMTRRSRMKDWFWVFDSNNSVDENELLRKEGFKVCLGGKLPYMMEHDRGEGIRISEKIGIKSPMWKEFFTSDEGIKYIEENKDKVFVMKPNASSDSWMTTVPSGGNPEIANKNIITILKAQELKDGYVLQEKIIGGVEVNLEYLCVEGEPIAAQINLEAKRISEACLITHREKGNMCGCAFDVCRIIPMDSQIVKKTISKMLPFIREKKHTGFADINCIIAKDGTVYFVEWCWRTGFAAHVNFFTNISKKDYLNSMADMYEKKYKPEFNDGWGASITINTDHPHDGYPLEVPDEIKGMVYLYDGYKKDDAIIQTGASSELMVVCGSGMRIKDALENAYENVGKIDIVNMDYRSDGLLDHYNSSPIRRYECLQELGMI